MSPNSSSNRSVVWKQPANHESHLHVFHTLLTHVTHLFHTLLRYVTHLFHTLLTHVTHLFFTLLTHVTHLFYTCNALELTIKVEE